MAYQRPGHGYEGGGDGGGGVGGGRGDVGAAHEAKGDDGADGVIASNSHDGSRPSTSFADTSLTLGLGRGMFKLATRHYVVFALWMAGCVLFALAPSPAPASPEALHAYGQAMRRAGELHAVEGITLEEDLADAQAALNDAKVWFWRFRAEHYERVMAAQARVDAAAARHAEYKLRHDAMVREAKAHLGVWSDEALAETRELFQERADAGKEFAGRMRFWQIIDVLLFSRSRNTGEAIMEIVLLLFNFVFTYTLGLVGALVSFLWSLPGIIASYDPSSLSGSAFFMLALFGSLCATAAIVAGFTTLVAGGATVVADGAVLALTGGKGFAALGDARRRQAQLRGSAAYPRYQYGTHQQHEHAS